ncbi:ABC transporter substrate-binding protein [Comamonas serinivorans]|uniref:ABC transporter substrate-binding protein n=1 Tax=Comamonas serinivorans TaxID=1082851 RepID=A0A1Y0EKX1_9BURK|nr:tripartite tricarboxylate transporter substrate binding protein [Comamonas serinivorans]ARU04273.1 ABC transporter substrate-binding protein [Comamonas serinivorans]
MLNRRQFGAVVPACGALGAPWARAAADPSASARFPQRPLRIIVQYQAGGMTDTLARIVAEPLSKRLGQPVIVENRPGAGGIIGTDHVAKSDPDGHTLLLTTPAPIAANLVLYSKLPYDPRKDLRMLSDLCTARTVLAVNPKVPAKDFASLIALIKAAPGTFAMGSWGAGTQPHQIQVFMGKQYGLETMHVAYKGEGPMAADLVGGTVQMTVGSVTTLAPHIAAGKLRALAVVGRTRAKGLPQVPTFAEQGFTDEVYASVGPLSLMLPTKTPDAIVERLGQEVQAIVATPAVAQRIEALGAEPVGNSPQQAAAAYAAFLPISMKLVRDTGVTLD